MANLLFNQFNGNSYSSYYGDINPSINKELNLNGNRIVNLPSPSTPSEPATKQYVDGTKNIVTDLFGIQSKINFDIYASSTKTGTGYVENYYSFSIMYVNITNSNSTVASLYKNYSSKEKLYVCVGSYNAIALYLNTFTDKSYTPNIELNSGDSGGTVSFSNHNTGSFKIFIPFICY